MTEFLTRRVSSDPTIRKSYIDPNEYLLVEMSNAISAMERRIGRTDFEVLGCLSSIFSDLMLVALVGKDGHTHSFDEFVLGEEVAVQVKQVSAEEKKQHG